MVNPSPDWPRMPLCALAAQPLKRNILPGAGHTQTGEVHTQTGGAQYADRRGPYTDWRSLNTLTGPVC